jgi:hypothetical protein
VFAVNTNVGKEMNSSLIDNKTVAQYGFATNRFYSLDTGISIDIVVANTFRAMVHHTETLVDGSTVKLRLLSDVFVNGNLIHKDNFVYGVAPLNGERLNIRLIVIWDFFL